MLAIRKAHVALGLTGGKPKVIKCGDSEEVSKAVADLCAKGGDYELVAHYGNGKLIKSAKLPSKPKAEKKEKKQDG